MSQEPTRPSPPRSRLQNGRISPMSCECVSLRRGEHRGRLADLRSLPQGKSEPAMAATPSPKFVAGVQGVLRARDDHEIRVVDSGLPGAPAIDEETRFRVGSLAKPLT